MTTLFQNEDHLKCRIEILKNEKHRYEWYARINSSQLIDIYAELCFLFDNYNELY